MARVRKKNARGGYHRFGQDIPAFPARWLYGLYALSPGTGCFAPVARDARQKHHELGLSTGRPGPRDFAVHVSRARRAQPIMAIAARLHVRDDAYAPLDEAGWRQDAADLGSAQSDIFFE